MTTRIVFLSREKEAELFEERWAKLRPKSKTRKIEDMQPPYWVPEGPSDTDRGGEAK